MLIGGLSVGPIGGVIGGLAVGLVDALRLVRDGKDIAIKKAPTRWQSALSVLGIGLILGLLFGLIGGGVGRGIGVLIARSGSELSGEELAGAELIGKVVGGVLGGLIGGAIGGLIFGLVFGLRGSKQTIRNDVQTVEALTWSWRRSLRGGALGLFGGGVVGLIVGLILGLIIVILVLVGFIGFVDSDGLLARLFWGLLIGLLFGLIFGLILGVILGLISGLVGTLIGGLSSGIVETKAFPNQGIQLSVRNAVLTGLLFGLSAGVVVWLTLGLFLGLSVDLIGLMFGLGSGLSAGLLAALWYGGLDTIQHFTLRFILYRNGHIPLDYARFLDYAAGRIFLRKLGGGYIFVHRMLLDYFAALEPKQTQAKKIADIILESVGYLCYLARHWRTEAKKFTNIVILDLPLRWRVGVLLSAGIVFATIVTCSTYVYRTGTALNYYFQGNSYADSDPEQALRYYTRATELDPGNVMYWNGLCWYGSLSGNAADVMYACERGVELAPDDGAIRDSRGLARALTGDYAGAIEDFEFFVEWSKKPDSNASNVAWREAWIAELKAGRNPFDEATLEQLRNE